MSRDRLLTLAVLGAVTVVAVMAAQQADAIPAFARKYQLSCSTCHAPFPRLKPYGNDFASRGFRMADPSQEPTRATYDVGDPWLMLSRELPLAIRLDGYASWKENAEADVDFETPWSFKLLSGGPIAKNISYYVYAIIEKGESIKLEDTFVQFNDLFGAPVSLTFGQFQVSDSLFKRELRLERNDYAIFKTRVGIIPTDLTYDRGFVLGWGAPAAIDVVLQLVNGNGIGEAENDNFDDNSLKNFSARLARQFGPVRVGLFGYWGKEELVGGPSTGITYFGPDLIVDLGKNWQLNLEYLERRDEDPFLVGRTGPELETRGGFAELHFFPKGQDGRWVLSALYNRVDSDDPAAETENASLTANYLLARNVRLMMEGARDLLTDASRITIGIVTAF
jgi:hypothetical protein